MGRFFRLGTSHPWESARGSRENINGGTRISRTLFGAALLIALSLLPHAEPQNDTADEPLRVEQSAENFEKEERPGAVEASKEVRTEEVTWKDNPNDCDLKTQYVRKDNLECLDKPVQQKEPQRTVRTAATSTGGCEQYRSIVNQYDWNTDVAMAVMEAESTEWVNGKRVPCHRNAANWNDHHGSCQGSFGLFQLACLHKGKLNGRSFSNPAANIAAAHQIYSQGGWTQWGAYTNGSYLAHL